ncbi:MAG TPA: CDP-diacylglycerol--serine O-phosphatidyltransferase [Bacteroidales bacterium]|nr:CDP-diacylglycerol--serine O-phosphatidyltransferase [Bacteroidales bacterium]
MRHIPNFITSLNLISGFIAIIFASRGDILLASWFIGGAMVFDYLDGFSARLLKAYSEIGRELDSLADVVSFGVAPAIIIFQLLYKSIAPDSSVIAGLTDIETVLILIAPAVMPACGALRLAIFNIDTTQTTTFRGLPTPANAIAVISIVIAASYSDSAILDAFMNSTFLLILYTWILSLLMVSRIPLLSLKIKHIRYRGNEGRYLLIVIIAAAAFIFGSMALPMIIPLYIVASLAQLAFPVPEE